MKKIILLLIIASGISCKGQKNLGYGETIEHETCEVAVSTLEEMEALWPIYDLLEPKGYKVMDAIKVTNEIARIRIGFRDDPGGNYNSPSKYYSYDFSYLDEEIYNIKQNVYLKSYTALENATEKVVKDFFQDHENNRIVIPDCIVTNTTIEN